MSLLSVLRVPPRGIPSAAASRLAARLAGYATGRVQDAVRIERSEPSGRPLLTMDGKPASIYVSVSHLNQWCAVTLDATRSVGVDLAPLDAAHRLAAWLQPEDRWAGAGPSRVMPAYCWAAREAAFKAVRLDIPFCPDDFALHALTDATFSWCYRVRHDSLTGLGRFSLHAGMVCALAWLDVAAIKESGVNPR